MNKIMSPLEKYCQDVNRVFRSGNYETSYYEPIQNLVTTFKCQVYDVSGDRSGGRQENIDLKLWHQEDDSTRIPPFGAIEAKRIGGIDNDAQEQIKVEAKKYEHVILTDNVTWEFYCFDGEVVRYNKLDLLKKTDDNTFVLNNTTIDLFNSLLNDFVLLPPNRIKSSSKLANYMADYAKTIKNIVLNIFEKNKDIPMYKELNALYEKLKQELLPELTIPEFSDMYAQTIVYGLFIAKYNDRTNGEFSRGEAINNLAKESILLKNFFQHIATSNNIHPTLNITINKLCKLFSLTNLEQLLNKEKEKAKDVIIHFYEDFLKYYDKKQKIECGVFYTPVQVVKFMINMVDKLLIDDFSILGGLSNNDTIKKKIKSDPYSVRNKLKYEKIVNVPKVAILDPACGTGTFSAEIIRYIKNKYFSGTNEVFYKDWLQQDNGLMTRLISFEIMMTSYVIAHLKTRRVITETLGNNKLDRELSSNIILTNTLAEPKTKVERNENISFFDFSGAITDEAENADKWKARRPIKVIIGNPPYYANSKNKYDISCYKYETDGRTPFNERKDLLGDDYVKFIRFAEESIQREGNGILAYITNNGYLDNITFRGMRASLLRTFDKIYIINLHGSSKKEEKSPDGTKDENIFDITIGVAIIIGVKTSNSNDWAKLFYSDIYGARTKKFELLEKNDISFKEIIPDNKNAFFIPIDNEYKEEYEQGISLHNLFKTSLTGVDSGNDATTIANNKKEIEDRLEMVRNALNDEEIVNIFGKIGRGGTPESIRRDVNRNGIITSISYRPFYDRWTYYTGEQGWLSRTKDDVMKNFIKNNDDDCSNIGLVFSRSPAEKQFSSIFVTNKITDIHCFKGTGAYVAPLYLLENTLFDGKTVNFNPNEYKKLVINLKNNPSDIEIFDYCYGILNDLNYREKFNEYLTRDFPRIPIILDEKMLKKYSSIGGKLRKLHLCETNISANLTMDCHENNLKIDFIEYKDKKLFINNNTAIIGIDENVWNYRIGGYQVLKTKMEGHKGGNLDITLFQQLMKISGIIKQTIEIQNRLKK